MVSRLNLFVRTSSNLIFVPLRSEDSSTLRIEILPIGRATPLESSAPSVVVHIPVAHKVGTAIILLWNEISGVRSAAFATCIPELSP